MTRMTYPVSSSLDNKEELKLLEGNQILAFSYEDVMDHHGGAMPAGVALAFRLLQLVFSAYEAEYGQLPPREGAAFYSGLGENGKGILDTAEYVLGVKTEADVPGLGERWRGKQAPEAPGGGKYYFAGTLGAMSWEASVKDGIIGGAFFSESKRRHEKLRAGLPFTEEEQTNLTRLRQEAEKALLSLRPEDLFTLTHD